MTTVFNKSYEITESGSECFANFLAHEAHLNDRRLNVRNLYSLKRKGKEETEYKP